MTHPAHRTLSPSRFALRLILGTAAVYVLAGSTAYGLISLGRPFAHVASGSIPPALWAGTVLLLTGSWWLHRAVAYVRLERQGPFRRCLFVALAAGTLFVGVQSYGLSCLLAQRPPADDPVIASDGHVAAFVFVGLHALHFVLALFALVFVTIHATTDRYDHEYHWGVLACTWFWHFLGAVWLLILAVFAAVIRGG